jgi:PHP family Zn ribbon phosphoesterase
MSTARLIKAVRVLKRTQSSADVTLYAATNSCRDEVLDHIQAQGRRGQVILHLGDGGTLGGIEFREERQVSLDSTGG